MALIKLVGQSEALVPDIGYVFRQGEVVEIPDKFVDSLLAQDGMWEIVEPQVSPKKSGGK